MKNGNGIISNHIKIGLVNTLDELIEKVSHLRALGNYVVGSVSGVWDMLHTGHIRYLKRAAELCDVLIVGVDSDEWVRQRKGPSRPVESEGGRIELLVDYDFVTAIFVIRSIPEYYELLDRLRPDVLILSETTTELTQKYKDDYSKYCKEMVILPRQAVTTTSSRLRDLVIEGKGELAKEFDALLASKHQETMDEVRRLIDQHLGVGGGGE